MASPPTPVTPPSRTGRVVRPPHGAPSSDADLDGPNNDMHAGVGSMDVYRQESDNENDAGPERDAFDTELLMVLADFVHPR
jgi:hypothetical protein